MTSDPTELSTLMRAPAAPPQRLAQGRRRSATPAIQPKDSLMQPAGDPPFIALRRLLIGYQVSQAIHVAATLGIADLLKDGPCSSADLAAATNTHPRTLYRLLRALASVGVFAEEADRRFALTPLGEYLRSDSLATLRPQATLLGRPYRWLTWSDLLHSVQTGENAAQHVLGMNIWEYRAQHPEEEAVFDATMSAFSRRHASAVLAAYNFARFGLIVDVAGGRGALLAAILASYPAARGVLFDQPQVVAHAGPILQAAGMSERVQLIGGSFFEAVPAGGDAYILKFIIHDWEDAEAVAILQACRRAMKPGATLLVIERVIGLRNPDPEATFSDLNMLVDPGGLERTREEFAALFGQAGLLLVGVTATASEVSVIEATAA
jgi:hypothetical protein